MTILKNIVIEIKVQNTSHNTVDDLIDVVKQLEENFQYLDSLETSILISSER